MRLELKQNQRQIISQSMRQSVEILQMNAQELNEYVNEIALENPVLEMEEERISEIDLRIKKQEWLDRLDEQNKVYYKYDWEEYTDGVSQLHADNENTLSEYLHLQLFGIAVSDEEIKILDYICEALDSKGYYTEPIQELCERFGIIMEEAQKYVKVIKTLEPAGVGAESLQECLLIQLDRMEQEQSLDLYIEKQMVQDYMELLAKNQLHVIARNMGLTIEAIKCAADRIKGLNPIPSRGFNNREWSGVLEPDVTIVKWKDYFQILLNEYRLPQFRVSHFYREMFGGSMERDVKIYLNNKIKQVERLQEAISKRNDTLLELTKYILEKQETFFIYGRKEFNALQMQEAARVLGVHESTISRAIRNKYLQCCWGIYPLSVFFNRGGVETYDHEAIMSNYVKCLIKELVDEEDKKHPYSDNQLTKLLTDKGICISRRTVTKYREAMEIKCSRERKVF